MKNLNLLLKNIVFVTLLLLVSQSTFAQDYGNKAGDAKKGSLPIAEHFEGGKEALLQAIQDEMQYPPSAKRNRIQGECIIHVTMQEDGTMKHVKVVKNIGGGCGEEAARIVKALKFKPLGYVAEFNVPVQFKL